MGDLKLTGVTKNFGTARVIHPTDLHIRDGEFTVFVGPSGCGKSTMLRMIAGLEDISQGQLDIDGIRVNDLPPAKRGIAMVFQSYALYPHLSVFENIAFPLRVERRPEAEVRAKVHAAAEVLKLTPRLDHRPGALSGGQRQRVAIGRAIVREPSVFLFDEPLSNLDAALRAEMRVELSRLHAKLANTMIYVTHDQIEAMTMADRIVVLNAGRIEQVGTPMQLFHQPVNRFVAGFLGNPTMNFLPARARTTATEGVTVAVLDGAVQGGTVLGDAVQGDAVQGDAVQGGAVLCGAVPDDAVQGGATAAPALTLTLPVDGNPDPGSALTLGIRPDDLRPDPNGLRARIDVVERLGNSTVLYCVLQSGQPICAVTDGTTRAQPGEVIGLGFDAAAAHVFDANGLALPRRQVPVDLARMPTARTA